MPQHDTQQFRQQNGCPLSLQVNAYNKKNSGANKILTILSW